MDERIEREYQEELKKKLDLVFHEPGDIKIGNFLIKEETTIEPDKVDPNKVKFAKARFNDISNFYNGRALAHYHGWKWNIIDIDGNSLLDTPLEFSNATILSNGRIKVEKTILENTSKDGNTVFTKKRVLYNLMDFDGNLLSDTWYDDISDFHNGYARVMTANTYNFIDKDFNLVFQFENIVIPLSLTNVDYRGMTNTHNFLIFKGQIIPKKIEMDDYEVKKAFSGYKCKNNKDKYTVNFMPVKRFGNRYTLCLDYKVHNLYLYDRNTNEYINLGSAKNVEYDNYLIYHNVVKKAYLIYNDVLYDISLYFDKYLKDRHSFCINKDIQGLLTKEEYELLNINNIDKWREEENKYNQKVLYELEKKKKEQELRNTKKEAISKEETRKSKERELLIKLQVVLESLKAVRSHDGKIPRIRFDDIFINVDNHIEINPELLDLLKYIDLSILSFNNVKMDNIDFSDCNLDLDPQTAYKKNLSNSNFTGIHIGPWMNFDGVDIRGCQFSDDNDITTINGLNSFIGAIYDETTTYNGISFTELFKDKDNQK